MKAKVNEMLTFLGVKMNPIVNMFITNNSTQPFTSQCTNRLNRPDEVRNKWRKELTWQTVLDIQEECQEAMNVWGYTKLNKEEDMKLFD
jgi:hypothetical protein